MKYETKNGLRRCYATDWYVARGIEENYNPCGHSKFDGGKWYCTMGGGTGRLEGYAGVCGNIYPWKPWELTDDDYQITFNDIVTGGKHEQIPRKKNKG